MQCIILGTRPEIIKFSPIIKEYEKRKLPYFVIHTGQHYDYLMDKVFREELGLEEPKYNLNVQYVPDMITKISMVLNEEKPDSIMVLGDTMSTLSGALAASRVRIPLIHLEAGLRSFDILMAEEVNRMIADHLATVAFAPTNIARLNLWNENISKNVYVYGNTIVDVLKTINIQKSTDAYILVTIHRAENVDVEERLTDIMLALEQLQYPVYFPVHPRTKKMLEKFNIKLYPLVKMLPPLGYLKMVSLLAGARVVITDSGGIQEEACILKVPCVTVRDNTERPETVKLGANVLVGTNPISIVRGVENMLLSSRNWEQPYGVNVAERIVDKCERKGDCP